MSCECTPYIWIYIENPLFCNIDLVLADRLSRCVNLSVYIRKTYLVIVNQIDCPDSAAHQRLNSVSSDAADSENRNATL